jgi:hypothetical protein
MSSRTRNSLVVLAVVLGCGGWTEGTSANSSGRSLLTSGSLNSNVQGNNEFINYFKYSPGWSESGLPLGPNAIDQYGWPLTAARTPNFLIYTPNQAERPGHYVLSWAGFGKIQVQAWSAFDLTNYACTGSASSGAGFCDNTACTGMQGFISGQTLNVTKAPDGSGCFPLAVGQPISNNSAIVSGTYNSSTGIVSLAVSRDLGVGEGAVVIVSGITGTGDIQQIAGTFTTTTGTRGTKINYTVATGLSFSISAVGQVQSVAVDKFGTPTIVTAPGTNSSGPCSFGSPCRYTVNYSQIVGSRTNLVAINPGGRFEVFSANDSGVGSVIATSELNAGASWKFILHATTSGNPVQWGSFYHIDDETDYIARALITQKKFRSIMKDANFATYRDLGNAENNNNEASTWSTRKPSMYITYGGTEMRPSIYAGNAAYNFISPINKYAVTWNGGMLYDKETIIVGIKSGAQLVPGSNSTTISTGTYNSSTGLVKLTVAGSTGISPNNRVTISGITGTNASSFNGAQLTVGGTGETTITYIVAIGLATPNFTGTVVSQLTNYIVQFSIDGGNTYLPVYASSGSALYNGSGYQPSTHMPYIAFVYDAGLNAWIIQGNTPGLENAVPPEVFAELCFEAGVDPWIEEPILSIDPITDYIPNYAQYIKMNYPNMHPWFETPDEFWNTFQAPVQYGVQKAMVSQTADPVAWAGGPVTLWDQEEGKIASLLGQAVSSVYSNPSQYDIVVGVQTADFPAYRGTATDYRLTARAFVTQSFPAQSGYIKAPAYNYASRVAVADYWNNEESYACCRVIGAPQETSDAYSYFYGSSFQQATIMNAYQATSIPWVQRLNTWYGYWDTWATSCAYTYISTCNVKGLSAYEGGNSTGGNYPWLTSDNSSSVAGANDANPCLLTMATIGTATSARISSGVLTISGLSAKNPIGVGTQIIGAGINATINGYVGSATGGQFTLVGSPANAAPVPVTEFGLQAAAGMPILLSNVSEIGGTSWATLAAAGNLTVGSNPTPQAVPILQNGSPVDCSSYGTLKSATLTYVGSKNWVNGLRLRSYYWPGINQAVPGMSGTPITGTDYANFVAAGGINPAQSNLGGGVPWNIASYDIYQFNAEGACTACTISGTTLTLGGEITGIFRPGDVIFGKCVTNPGPTTSPSCRANNAANEYPQTTIISGIGRADGDKVTLSQSQNAAIPKPSPMGAFIPNTQPGMLAIQQWNNSMPFLLNRDVDPESNDDTPMWLEKTA